MSDHTPGPWAVNFTKFSEVRAENGVIIARCGACVLSCEEQIKRGAQPAASRGVQRVTVRGSACPQVETYFEVGGE